MGHERVGTLPKTQRWRVIVQQIGSASSADFDPAPLAEQTLRNVRDRFRRIDGDEGTQAAFRFLVSLAVASRKPDDPQFAELLGAAAEKATPLKLAAALRRYTADANKVPEYSDIAESAAIDALAGWYESNRPQTLSLFDSFNTPQAAWHRAGNGAGFCELSRLFFTGFVQRHLNYFLEREASSVLGNVEARNHFQAQIEAHVQEVSQHAFETSKITQSWAAGWFANVRCRRISFVRPNARFAGNCVLRLLCRSPHEPGAERRPGISCVGAFISFCHSGTGLRFLAADARQP